MKIDDVVYIQWYDHYSAGGGWMPTDEVRDKASIPFINHSVGKVVSINKRQVVLAQSWGRLNPDDMLKVSDFIVILRGVIHKQRKLNI